MSQSERAVVFNCEGQQLIGILHDVPTADLGVVIVVGGPQYRVGSHRQFLLLARYLAENGISVLRFDYRGMGDSEGDIRSFEDVNTDIEAAINTFFDSSSSLKSVVLWGLCDAASASLFYAHQDPRVKGLILLNPWVKTAAGEAKTYLRHYYIRRIFDKKLWQKIVNGEFKIQESLSSLLDLVRASSGKGNETESQQGCQIAPLPERMLDGLQMFNGWIGIILSGDDLTAAEFQDLIKASKPWQKAIKSKKVEFYSLAEANHTFSRQVWRDEVADCSLRWLKRS